MLGALFPISMGVALYGWRSVGVILFVMGSAAAGMMIWRQIGARGPALHWPHVMWLAMLLGLMFPVHLLGRAVPWMGEGAHPWAVLAAAGLLLIMFVWLLGGEGFAWVHPLLLTFLTVCVIYPTLMAPRAVLHRTRIVTGRINDLQTSADTALPTPSHDDAWISRKERPASDAIYVNQTAAERLTAYTLGRRTAQRAFVSLESFLRDAMPPLEDLVVGGHPGPIGASSAIAVIIGGLFLLHRGVIDYRIPLWIVVSAYLSLLLLPVPVSINEEGAQWRSLLLRRDWATIITFVNYEILASPLLLTAFFIATSPAISPNARSARRTFAILTGFLAAAAQLYLSVAVGPYVALLLAGLISPWLNERSAASAASI
jgi:Na+-translocating ferredoxin:NAD+ oxidoreductase RnfD subunit